MEVTVEEEVCSGEMGEDFSEEMEVVVDCLEEVMEVVVTGEGEEEMVEEDVEVAVVVADKTNAAPFNC